MIPEDFRYHPYKYPALAMESRLYENRGLMHDVLEREFTARNGYAMAGSSA